MHLEIEKNKDYIFNFNLYDYNIKTVPDSCNVTITNNSGDTVVSGVGVVATDGTVSYTFNASDNGTQADNFKIKWSIVVSGVTTNYNQLFDVVLVPVNNIVTDEDIFLHCSELRDRDEHIYKTTSEGSATSLISNRFDADTRDWTGGYLEIYIDDTTVHHAKITAYNSATNTVTFIPSYTGAILTDVNFKIRASYQRYINEAFNNFVYRDVRNKVNKAGGYLDDNVLRNLTIYKTLCIIAQSEYEEEGDKWHLRYADFEKKYDSELVNMNEPYDSDGGGSISDRENDERPQFTSVDAVR